MDSIIIHFADGLLEKRKPEIAEIINEIIVKVGVHGTEARYFLVDYTTEEFEQEYEDGEKRTIINYLNSGPAYSFAIDYHGVWNQGAPAPAKSDTQFMPKLVEIPFYSSLDFHAMP
jgi:hypothetical protein